MLFLRRIIRYVETVEMKIAIDVAFQFFNPLSKYWGRLPPPRFPLIYDSFIGRAQALGEVPNRPNSVCHICAGSVCLP